MRQDDDGWLQIELFLFQDSCLFLFSQLVCSYYVYVYVYVSDATCVRSLDLNYEPITVCEHEELLAAYDCSETNVYVYRYVPYSTGSYDFMIEMGLVTYPFVVDMN